VVREGVGAGGRNDQALYAHMNNKIKKKTTKKNMYRFLCKHYAILYKGTDYLKIFVSWGFWNQFFLPPPRQGSQIELLL
jgi:hypothetical protein